MSWRRWGAAGLLAGAVAVAGYRRRALTLDGALGAVGVGTIVLARGGLPAAGALVAFFVSSSALSKLGEAHKQDSPLAQAKGARRDVWQVLANGGVATLGAALGRPDCCLGALAAASADTWSTELGMLARRPPRSITTLRQVAPGTSGGITPEGLAAGVGGALAVGLAWSLLDGRPKSLWAVTRSSRPSSWRAVPAAIFAGTAGSLADSLLGALIQALYRCPTCAELTEDAIHHRCGQPAELVHGYRWVTNDTINTFATLVGAAVGSIAL